MRVARGFALCAVPVAVGAMLVVPARVPAQDHTAAASGPSLFGRDLATYALVHSLGGMSSGFGAPRAKQRDAAPGASCIEPDGRGQLVHPARCSLLPPEGTPAPTPTPTPGENPTTGEGPATPPADPGTGGSTSDPAKAGFAYYPPGNLFERDQGRGRVDRFVYFPNIIFPLKLGDGQFPHMNSQIWGYGGGGWNGKGAAGGTDSDPRNYDPLKQRDNYCEVRGWEMPLCPGGAGHQGQDIRPPSYKDNYWEAVAVADGQIVNVTSNTTVQLKTDDGTDFYYLHMHPKSITVKTGAKVKQGQVLGKVSRYMGGTVSTSLHLHMQVRQRIKIGSTTKQVYVPTFTSLIAALRRAKGIDPGIDANGNLIVDAGLEIGAPQPTPAPTPQPTPTPTPSPAPTPAPEPTPTPAPQPEPTPAPAPEPAPAPQPEPTPAPQPEPTPSPEPAPQPQPEPTPAPAPEPTPAPQPAPAPEPAPQPAPQPTPKPTPAPVPTPPQQQGWWDSAKGNWNSWWNWATDW